MDNCYQYRLIIELDKTGRHTIVVLIDVADYH